MYSNKGKGLKSVSTLGLAIGALFCASSAYSAPTILGDKTLDNLTAGSSVQQGSGGAIVGNSASATLNTSAAVDISGEVQSTAKALNLVNSSESTVANGVNVWGGEAAEVAASSTAIMQTNNISQEQRRSASMPNYSRPEADTYVSVNTSGSESHSNQFSDINSVTDLVTNYREAHNESSGYVDTTIMATTGGVDAPTIDTNTGKGVAVAGTVDATLDGGEVQFGLSVGGGISAAPDSSSDSYGGMDVTRDNEDADVSIYGRIIMPELEINITGAGCGVAMGSCGSNGESDETTNDVVDRSTQLSQESSEVGSSQHTESTTEEYRSAFELNDAQAEYIVVDDSTLNVTASYRLTLSGSAQSGINAMNVVNATGSAVANGVNVAHSKSSMMDGSSITQTNVIAHSR